MQQKWKNSEMRKKRKYRTLVLINLFLMIFLLNGIVVHADQWLNHYNNSSFSLLANYKWRLTLGRPAGTLLSISVQVNKLIDIYIVDEDNMNKYWAGQSFSSYSSGTFIGVSGKTFQFTLPSGTTCYLLIDNTDGFGTPTQGDVSGSVRVMYLDTSSPPLPPSVDPTGLIWGIIISTTVAIIAITFLSSYMQKRKEIEELKLKDDQQPKQSVGMISKRFCKFCGNELSIDDIFCIHCGKGIVK